MNFVICYLPCVLSLHNRSAEEFDNVQTVPNHGIVEWSMISFVCLSVDRVLASQLPLGILALVYLLTCFQCHIHSCGAAIRAVVLPFVKKNEHFLSLSNVSSNSWKGAKTLNQNIMCQMDNIYLCCVLIAFYSKFKESLLYSHRTATNHPATVK